MNIYHIWHDCNREISGEEFVALTKRYLDLLIERKVMVSYRFTQMKLGFRSMDLPDYHVSMDFESMQQMDDAMSITLKDKEVDEAHRAFNKFVDVETIQHALYRDV